MYGYMDPSQVEQLGKLGTIPGRISDEQATLERARALRDQRSPQGSYVRGGYVAASPLQHIAQLGGQFKGGRAAQESQGKISGMRDEQAAARAAYMKSLIEQLRGGGGGGSGGAPGYADPYSGPRMA